MEVAPVLVLEPLYLADRGKQKARSDNVRVTPTRPTFCRLREEESVVLIPLFASGQTKGRSPY